MLQLETKEHGENVIIALEGSVDASTTQQARDVFTALLNRGKRHFIIDLSGVEFIDSSGLGALVGFFKKVRVGEGDVKLAGPSDSIVKIFQLTRLDKVFAMFPTREAALNAS